MNTVRQQRPSYPLTAHMVKLAVLGIGAALTVTIGACSEVGPPPGDTTGDSPHGPGIEGNSDFLTPGEPVQVPKGCTPPPLLELSDIPDDPALDDGDEDTLAIFEVKGVELVGKFVRDQAAAQGGLKLWQEVVLRIPSNHLLDLVQLNIFQNSGQAAIFNRTGQVNTQHYGLKIGFNTTNFESNQKEVCAPLQPRRKTFDWSLVHEFGHLRGWLDRTWDKFEDTFPDVQGTGEGYPEDGSPILQKDFVTSYAERSDGDEDYAETWTTYVMLDEKQIPPQRDDEPLAVTKVRWMASQPGLADLRKAIRISEPDGGGVTVQPPPRLFAGHEPEILPPDWLLGTWQGPVPADGAGGSGYEQRFVFRSDDIVASRVVDGVETDRRSLRELHRKGQFVQFEVVQQEPSSSYFYVAEVFKVGQMNDNFLADSDGGAPRVRWSRDNGPQDITLQKVE